MPLKPNILLITADHMRADAVGFENPGVFTPNLDRLAEEGSHFTGAYCVNPICPPSRASILTGRYPHCNGVWGVGLPVSEDETTICDILRPFRYRTAAVGKMHFRPQCRDHLVNEPETAGIKERPRRKDGTYFGFDERHITEDIPVGEYYEWLKEAAPGFIPGMGRPASAESDVWISGMPAGFHQTHWIGARSAEVIEKHDASRPLFLWTSFVAPHPPCHPPESYARMYENSKVRRPVFRDGEHDLRPGHLRRQTLHSWPGGAEEQVKPPEEIESIIRHYYASITFIDDAIGRILKALQDKKMLENTVVVFTADHGELLGDHRLFLKGPWMYEGLVRIPMLFYGPGIPKNNRCPGLMENVDILPTLLELIGEKAPYGVQGISQWKVLSRQTEAVRDSAVTSYDAHDIGINIKSLRTGRYKLVVFANEKYGELYDYQTDPDELHNLYFEEAYKTVKLQLFEQLCSRLISDQDPLPQKNSLW